jgi:hypothetical protein
VRRNAVSIFRIYAQYEPLRVFLTVAAILLLCAGGVWIRFVVAYAQGNGSGHVQSLILGAVLFNAAVVLAALGVIGDLLSAQRTMIQRTHERVRRIELQLGVAPSHYEALVTPEKPPAETPPAPAERPAEVDSSAAPGERRDGASTPSVAPGPPPTPAHGIAAAAREADR